MRKEWFIKLSLFVVTLALWTTAQASSLNEPLPSWQDGPIKNSLIQFVRTTTDQSSKDYVPPDDRIATFDNDGTLWVEQPMYTQVEFMIDRFKQLAPQHPEWKQNPALQPLFSADHKNITPKTFETLFAVTSTQMNIEEFNVLAKKWLASTKNPRFHHHYTDLIYLPMLEVISYLQDNNFKIYIVSGGDQRFIRAFSQNVYGIPVEHVIGMTTHTQYTNAHHRPMLTRLPTPLLTSNFSGKPEAIDLFIGKKPIIAFGNSDGDQQMLEWTQSGPGKRLMLLVHHDDAKREYAYDEKSKVGTFSAALFTEAKKNNWHIISMKNDWKVIFPFEESNSK